MEDNFNKHLGNKLKLRRLALGLTQTKVAKAINVTFQQIQKYEKGTNGVSSIRLLQLANYLKVPVNYFFEDFSDYLINLERSQEGHMNVNYNFLVKIYSELNNDQKLKFSKSLQAAPIGISKVGFKKSLVRSLLGLAKKSLVVDHQKVGLEIFELGLKFVLFPSALRLIFQHLFLTFFLPRLAANYNQALSEIDKKLPDVAIIDVKLDKGDNDGLELLSHIKTKDKNIPVIIITGHANVEMAIKALKAGAFEFIEKPFNQERLLNFVNRAVENINLKNKNKEFESKLFYSYELVGVSDNIKDIKDQINKISVSESRIFINGPTGSGKELIARKIHKESKRQKSPFVILNGALLDIKKYELELFGEEKVNGSITYGALEKASKGILLIDEISEIPLDTQSKILRVLIDQKFKRINGSHDINVDVRIICSSSKDIKKEIENGNFREDLYHRLNVFEININPLKDRASDIPLLVEYFSEKISTNYNLKKLSIDTNNNYLLNYDWPGNVRELRNLIERIAILSPDSADKISNIIKESLKTPDIKNAPSENSLSIPLKEARENFEKEYLTTQLKKFNGNISKTADFIGMERSALHRKLKGLGIKELN